MVNKLDSVNLEYRTTIYEADIGLLGKKTTVCFRTNDNPLGGKAFWREKHVAALPTLSWGAQIWEAIRFKFSKLTNTGYKPNWMPVYIAPNANAQTQLVYLKTEDFEQQFQNEIQYRRKADTYEDGELYDPQAHTDPVRMTNFVLAFLKTAFFPRPKS